MARRFARPYRVTLMTRALQGSIIAHISTSSSACRSGRRRRATAWGWPPSCWRAGIGIRIADTSDNLARESDVRRSRTLERAGISDFQGE